MKDIVKSQTNAEVKIINGKKVKLHRRSRRSNVTTYTAVAVAVITTVGLILSLCFFFNLKQVAVNGVTLYTSDQILEVGGVVNGANLFRTNTDLIEQRLVDTLPYVESATVSKDFPNSLTIDIVEAEKIAEIEDGGKYYVLSSSGRILETANPTHDTSLPLVKGFELASPEINKELRSADDYKAKVLMQVLEDIKNSGIQHIEVIDITNRTDIVLWYEDRIDLRVGSSMDMEYKLTCMKAVIEKSLEPDYDGTLRYNGPRDISGMARAAQTERPAATASVGTAPAPAETEAQTEPLQQTEQQPTVTEPQEYTGWEE